jgi:mono/diheme cytochrome c family protein
MKRWWIGILALLVSGCEETAPDLAEWTVADHNHQTQTRRNDRTPDMIAKDTRTAPSQRNAVVDVTWAKQCASCHGKRGRGDGPQSTMVKAKDLSIPEWQDTVTDEQLAKSIREGKDKMPAFNLPDSVIQGLVEQIRKWRKRNKDDKGEDDDGPEGAPLAPNAPASTPAAPPPASAAPPISAAPGAPGKPADGPAKSAASNP